MLVNPIRAGVLALVGVLGLAPRQSTPPAPAPQQPTFHAGTDVVEVDVSVFDKNRHPVHGLKAEDFTILQDGKPQPIVAFAPVDLPDPIPMTAKWMADAPVDVDTNEVTDRRLVVILIDDAILANNLGSVNLLTFKAVKAAANRVIDELGPADSAAVVFTGAEWDGQGLTTDRARLRATVARLAVGPMDQTCHPMWSSAGGLRNVVDALAAVPHRRKIIVDISPGLSVHVLRNDGGGCVPRAANDVAQALAAAESADVNVYGVDPTGLHVVAPPPRALRGSNPGPASSDASGVEFLESISENTGGHAIARTNDAASRVPEIFEQNGSYYLLGYVAPVNGTARESLKRVEVKVNRQGVDVRSRNIYAAPAASNTVSKPAPPVEESAIADIVPNGDLGLRVTAVPIRGEDGAATVALVIGVRQPATIGAAMDTLATVVHAFTPDGSSDQIATASATVPLTPPMSDPGGSAIDRSEVIMRVPLRPGRYALRIAVHSAAAKREGSVYTDVTVPDFEKEALSLSGALLSVSPGPRAAPADLIAGLVPILPTAQRTLDRASAVSAFVRAYQGGASPARPVSLHIRVLGDRDAIAMERTETLPADAFAQDRSAGETMKLRVADWTPGPYLLRIEATAGKHTATREVRFDVR